jgi:hypothetical protein
MIDDDDWRLLRQGRLDELESRIIERALRSRRSGDGRGLSRRALIGRVRTASRGVTRGRVQVMVKAAGSRKSRAGVRACVRYIARLRENDRMPAKMFDEFCRRLPPERVLAAVEDWRLEDDKDNFSAAGRRDPAAPLGERERLRLIQAWHLIFSVVSDDEQEDAETGRKLERAAAFTIDAIFTRAGHRVIWGLHTDRPGRPHVHVVIKAESELGGRLRFDRYGDFFDTIRRELTDALQKTGLMFDATRREDRGEIRDLIVTGQAPLRTGRGNGDGDLARRAPSWFARFGEEHVIGQRRRTGEQLAEVPAWRRWMDRLTAPPEPKLPPIAGLAEARAPFAKLYREPDKALVSFLWLAIEGGERDRTGTVRHPIRRLAEWYVGHRPEVFGEFLPGARPEKATLATLRKLVLPLPPSQTAPPLDTAVVHDYRRLRWLRRVLWDRRGVAGSLVRLAEAAVNRTGERKHVRPILQQLDASLTLPVGEMPTKPRSARTDGRTRPSTLFTPKASATVPPPHPPGNASSPHSSRPRGPSRGSEGR